MRGTIDIGQLVGWIFILMAVIATAIIYVLHVVVHMYNHKSENPFPVLGRLFVHDFELPVKFGFKIVRGLFRMAAPHVKKIFGKIIAKIQKMQMAKEKPDEGIPKSRRVKRGAKPFVVQHIAQPEAKTPIKKDGAKMQQTKKNEKQVCFPTACLTSLQRDFEPYLIEGRSFLFPVGKDRISQGSCTTKGFVAVLDPLSYSYPGEFKASKIAAEEILDPETIRIIENLIEESQEKSSPATIKQEEVPAQEYTEVGRSIIEEFLNTSLPEIADNEVLAVVDIETNEAPVIDGSDLLVESLVVKSSQENQKVAETVFYKNAKEEKVDIDIVSAISKVINLDFGRFTPKEGKTDEDLDKHTRQLLLSEMARLTALNHNEAASLNLQAIPLREEFLDEKNRLMAKEESVLNNEAGLLAKRQYFGKQIAAGTLDHVPLLIQYEVAEPKGNGKKSEPASIGAEEIKSLRKNVQASPKKGEPVFAN